MITVIYLPNPFKPSSRVIKPFTPDEAKILADLQKHFDVNNPADFVWAINGRYTDAAKIGDTKLQALDFVVIAPRIMGGGGGGGGKNVIALVAGIALMAFTGGAGAGLMGILGTTTGSLGLGLALYGGGSLLMGNQKMPKVDMPTVSGAFEGGYNWSPDTIRVQPGTPIPITFGSMKTSGQLISRRIRSGSYAGKPTQYLDLLLCAGEGPLSSITDVKINDIPIASVGGASYEVKLGENNQSENILSRVVEYQGFSSELPISETVWVTKAQSEAGASITLDFCAPAGLYGMTSEGAQVPVTAMYRLQYREIGSGSWIDATGTTMITLGSQNTRRPHYFQLYFTPPDASKLYEFRAQNYSLKYYNDTYWGGAYTETPATIIWGMTWLGLTVTSKSTQTFPGVALVAISLPATENLSGSMPKVSWTQTRANIYAWNPTAEAYQAKDATNIAWMVYDLIHQCKCLYNTQTAASEYVAFGEAKEKIDYAAFDAWATFCGAVVSDVGRCVGNMLLDSADQLWPIIQKIASSGRGFVIQQAGVFKPVWDAAKTVSQIFTAGNIINGSIKGGFLSESERATAIEASFINQDNGYERDTLFVSNSGYNPAGLVNPTQVFFYGLTDPKVVFRAARHLLRKNQYLKRTLSFQADIDSIVSEIGDIIGVQSDITDWGVGGRVLGATTTSVVIDQTVTMTPGTAYSLLVRFPDGSLVRKVVDAVLVSTTTSTLAFTGDPWATAPVRFSVYSFGVNTLETKPFQITSITRNGDLQATIECLEYVAGVYSDDADFPVIDYTSANAAVNTLTVNADPDTGKLYVSWSLPEDKDYTGSIVYIDGKPQGFFTTEQTGGDFTTTPGTHTVTVVPIGAGGRAGTEAEEEITLGDPTLAAASGVSLASSVVAQSDGTSFVYISGTFTIPALANTVLVEVGAGAAPESWATVQDSRVPSIYYGPVPPGALFTFRFTARNRYATASPVTESINTVGDTTAPAAPAITAVAYLKTVLVNISLSNPPSDLAGFEVWRHTDNDAGAASLVAKVSATEGRGSYTDQSPVYLTDLFYWAKSVDKWGNKSDFGSAAVSNITHIKAVDITAEQITGKDFRTDLDVGETVDGVRFTAAGIEMWQDGIRKVLIPVSGDPDFKGVITALAGYIGGWEIAEGYLQGGNIRLDSTGAVQTVDFVSGNKGWKADGVGDAEFNNIRARGAVKTVVFEKDEISVVGGRTLIRPAGVVAAYDYATYIQAHFDEAWAILCNLLGVTETAPDITVADYATYLALDQAYYREIATAMGFATYETGINPAVYDDTTMQAYLLACWATINSTLGTTHDAPTFPAMTQAAFAAMEAGYWNLAAEIIDNPPAFTAAIGANDCLVTLDDTEDFNIGDIVRIKDGLSNDYWGIVSSVNGNAVEVAGASGDIFAMTAGQTIVNYGPVNAGGVLLDGQAPMIDVYTHNGEPWNGTDIKVRIGNLKGWGTINHDVFGIAIGDPAGDYLIYDDQSEQLQLTGSINIVSARGIGNFSDAGALAGKDDIDLSYVTDAGTLAGVDDLDGVGDGATYKKTTANEKSGAGRAYSGLDTNNRLITAVIPTTNIGTPAAAGLFLGKDYLGFYNAGWKTYMDNAGNFALIGGGTHGLSWNAATGVLTIAGSISILSGSGYGNFTDKPTSLAGISSAEGSKLSGIADGADVTANNTAYDTARVAGVAAATVKDNAANAISQLNDISADDKLTPSEKKATKKEWDAIVSEKTKNDTQADAFTVSKVAYGAAYNALNSYITPLLANLTATSDITGTTFRATFKSYYDARTDILNAIAAKAKALADAAQSDATDALADAATAQSTADNAATAASDAQTSANTANNLLADIADDNKFTAVEKQLSRKEWDIIAAEQPINSLHAMNIVGFTPGLAEAGFDETASDAYWSAAWTKLNTLLDESNAEPAFAAQTYAAFVAEESTYFGMVKQVIDSEIITVPPTPDVLALNTLYIAAFQALATYLNAGSTWSSGVPSWIADASLSAPTDITGSTFRSTWKAYYDARTALLNAIAAKAQIIADLAQSAAGSVALRVDTTLDMNNRVTTAVIPTTSIAPDRAGLFMGANYMGFHDGSEWKTYMDRNGNFALDGAGAHGLAWDAARGVLTVAGDITVQDGSITGAKLAARAVTADKIMVSGGGAALNPDPTFMDASEWSRPTMIATVADGIVGNKALMITTSMYATYNVKPLPFDPLKQYRLRCQARASSGIYSDKIFLNATACDAAGTLDGTKSAYSGWFNTSTSWEDFEFLFLGSAISGSGTFLRIGVTPYFSGTGSIQFQDLRIEEVIPGTLIQDGAITTDKLTARCVTAAKIATDAIKSTNYSTTAGSFFDLANGDLKLGGSSAPKFSFSTSTETCTLAGFTVDADDMTAGSGSSAIGISTDTSKKAFWAGNATPANAPFFVNHNGTGRIGLFDFSSTELSAAYADATYDNEITISNLSDPAGDWIFLRSTTSSSIKETQIRPIGIISGTYNTSQNRISGINSTGTGQNWPQAVFKVWALASAYCAFHCDGNAYFEGNVSVASFTDRTEMPKSMEEALEIINTMQPTKGKVDYKRLSNKAKRFTIKTNDDGTEEIEEGRDLTKTVSALVMVVQKLQEEIIRLSDRLAKLEKSDTDEEREYVEAVEKAIGENRGNIRVRVEANK